jgi:ribonucleotide reductase alpha subunit
VGDVVKVSDGTRAPSNQHGIPYRAWMSHNFTGTLVEKIDGDLRAMRIEMAPEPGFTIAFDVSEEVYHTFEAA